MKDNERGKRKGESTLELCVCGCLFACVYDSGLDVGAAVARLSSLESVLIKKVWLCTFAPGGTCSAANTLGSEAATRAARCGRTLPPTELLLWRELTQCALRKTKVKTLRFQLLPFKYFWAPSVQKSWRTSSCSSILKNKPR